MSDLQWQPMQSAPKDGSVIWVTNGFGLWLAYWEQRLRWREFTVAQHHPHSKLQIRPIAWQPGPILPDISPVYDRLLLEKKVLAWGVNDHLFSDAEKERLIKKSL